MGVVLSSYAGFDTVPAYYVTPDKNVPMVGVDDWSRAVLERVYSPDWCGHALMGFPGDRVTGDGMILGPWVRLDGPGPDLDTSYEAYGRMRDAVSDYAATVTAEQAWTQGAGKPGSRHPVVDWADTPDNEGFLGPVLCTRMHRWLSAQPDLAAWVAERDGKYAAIRVRGLMQVFAHAARGGCVTLG